MTSRIIADQNRVEELYIKRKELNRRDVEELREWVTTSFYIKILPDIFIIACLHSCYYNIEEAKKCIWNFLSYKVRYPNLFQLRNPVNEEYEQDLSTCLQTILPKRTKENYDILYVRLVDSNPQRYNFEHQVILGNMICSLQIYQKGLNDGLIFIQDCANNSFGHCFKMNLFVAKAIINYVQDALPVRLKAIHAINMNYISEKLGNMLKPFINQNTRSLLNFHTSMETVYETIPKELLPVELGGSVGTIKELQDNLMENLRENQDFFKEDEESMRILKSVFKNK